METIERVENLLTIGEKATTLAKLQNEAILDLMELIRKYNIGSQVEQANDIAYRHYHKINMYL